MNTIVIQKTFYEKYLFAVVLIDSTRHIDK